MSNRQYEELGYTIFDFLNEAKFEALRAFTEDWIYTLIESHHIGLSCRHLPLEMYHVWSKDLAIAHGTIFRAKNRHLIPPKPIRQIVQNIKLMSILESLELRNPEFWDEGFGWFAFRFIRPGVGDGYPTSRKAWGPAKNVVSAYVPIIGFAPEQTIALVDGSHLKDYPSILPEGSKFCCTEYRLHPDCKNVTYHRPKLERGQALLFHPKTLHTEDIQSGTRTRLSLEFRLVNPADAPQ